MRKIYLWQQEEWPHFTWDNDQLAYKLAQVRALQGKLDITRWLDWFLDCLEAALLHTEATINTVLQKASFWEKHRATPMNERQIKMVNLLWEGFEGKLSSSKWAKITKCSSDTALRDIQDLVAKDVLAKQDEGGRSTYYVLHM